MTVKQLKILKHFQPNTFITLAIIYTLFEAVKQYLNLINTKIGKNVPTSQHAFLENKNYYVDASCVHFRNTLSLPSIVLKIKQ